MDNKDSNQENDFIIKPAIAKKWIQNLPLGDTGEASKQLYLALKKVNQQNNHIAHHIAFLETIAPTFNSLYSRLSKSFTGVSLPLDPKAANIANITSSLVVEVLKSYLTIIKTLLTHKPVGWKEQLTFSWKKQLSFVLHQTLIYYSRLLSARHLVYQPYPKGMWRKIYWCYLKADELKLLDKRHFNYEHENTKTTIDYEFKRLLLLSLLSSYDLALENIRDVHSLMPFWIKHVDILNTKATEKSSCFNIALLSDLPPYHVDKNFEPSQDTSKILYLSTQPLIKLLSEFENKKVINIENKNLSKACIQQLLASWSRSHLRLNDRKKGLGFVDIVASVPAIHSILNQHSQPINVESQHVSDASNEDEVNLKSTSEPQKKKTKKDNLDLGLFITHADENDDVWDRVFETSINEVMPNTQNWTNNKIEATFNFSKSILLDYSDDGYRLSINDKKIDGLKHNGLVAVREHAQAPWALAQVKWLHFSKMGDLQFGAKILSHHVLSILSRYAINGELCKPLPCLFCLDKKTLKLITPKLPTNLKGKTLEVEIQNNSSQLHLKSKLMSTPAFDVYEVLDFTPSDDSAEIIDNTLKTPPNDTIWDIV